MATYVQQLHCKACGHLKTETFEQCLEAKYLFVSKFMPRHSSSIVLNYNQVHCGSSAAIFVMVDVSFTLAPELDLRICLPGGPSAVLLHAKNLAQVQTETVGYSRVHTGGLTDITHGPSEFASSSLHFALFAVLVQFVLKQLEVLQASCASISTYQAKHSQSVSSAMGLAVCAQTSDVSEASVIYFERRYRLIV